MLTPRDGDEPDARYSLANERTFLAWTRTALAMVAGAVAIQAPIVGFQNRVADVVSAVLLALAAVLAVDGWWRWHRSEAALRAGTPLPAFHVAFAVALSLVVVIGLVAVGLLLD